MKLEKIVKHEEPVTFSCKEIYEGQITVVKNSLVYRKPVEFVTLRFNGEVYRNL